MHPAPEIFYILALPDWSLNEVTPFQGFAPGLPFFVPLMEQIPKFPADIVEPTLDLDIRLARKRGGDSAWIWSPVNLTTLQVKEFVLSGLRDGLMQPVAFAQFRGDFARHLIATQSATAEGLRLMDKRIQSHEHSRQGLIKAVETGIFSASIVERLNTVDSELSVMKEERAKAEPVRFELPENLPDLYKSYVANLVETLSDEGVVGRAGDNLRELIDRIVVRHDAVSNAHQIELEGRIVKLLQAGSANANVPAGGGAYEAAAHSLDLVAGTGFEPVTFRL